MGGVECRGGKVQGPESQDGVRGGQVPSHGGPGVLYELLSGWGLMRLLFVLGRRWVGWLATAAGAWLAAVQEGDLDPGPHSGEGEKKAGFNSVVFGDRKVSAWRAKWQGFQVGRKRDPGALQTQQTHLDFIQQVMGSEGRF